MKEFWIYTLARIGLFLASWAVIAGVWALVFGGFNLPVPILLAAVVSAVGSFYWLKGPRERFAARVDARAHRMAQRFEQARAKEDQD